MIHKQLQNIGWFVGLLLLQALILNNVNLFGYATPFLYVYFILRYDTSVSRNYLMLMAFALGLSIDFFSNTPGMNAAATVLLAFVRPFLLSLFTPRDVADEITPSLDVLGRSLFLKYLLVSVLIHHLALYSMMFFSFSNLLPLLIKSIASTLLTAFCILGMEWFRSK